MTPTLRSAAPTPSQIGDVRSARSAGDPASTFDASFAAALKTRPVTRDAGSISTLVRGSEGDAAGTSAPAGTTATGTTPATGAGEASASAAPVDESAPQAGCRAPVAPFTFAHVPVPVCVPTQSADGAATMASVGGLATTVAPAPAGTATVDATAGDLTQVADASGLPGGAAASGLLGTTATLATTVTTTITTATSLTCPTDPALGGAVPGVAVPSASGSGAPQTVAAPIGLPAADGPDRSAFLHLHDTTAETAAAGRTAAGAAAATPVDAQVALPLTSAVPAPTATAPGGPAADVAGGTVPKASSAPVTTLGAAPSAPGSSPTGDSTPDVPGGSSGAGNPALADAPEPPAGPTGSVLAGDGDVAATRVEPATPAALNADDAAPTTGGLTRSGLSQSQPAPAQATPPDVPAAMSNAMSNPMSNPMSNAMSDAMSNVAPAVTAAAAPAPAPTPMATATPTQQGSLPGSVPLPHQQIATAVSPMLRRADGSYSVNINLEPEHLGRVSLQLHIRGGEVAVSMQAADPSAREMLRDNLGQLRQQLEQQGLKAAQLDVRDDSPFARQFQSPQGDGAPADSRTSGQRATGAGSDQPTSPDSSLQESTVGQPDDTGALDLHL